jgi:peptidoglycan/xylan/chitin deacetylase (PgdA/CDA1 family)
MNKVTKYKEFISGNSLKLNLRTKLRTGLINTLALKRKISNTTDWLAFPYYHHVFDDEVNGFERQLKYMKNYGDFISIDDAQEMITSDKRIKGRYFCLSFDDGFHNCYTNMMSVTSRNNIPVIVYLATDFINLDLSDKENLLKVKAFDKTVNKVVPFLSWEECREMLANQVTFGSHTCGHVNLSTLSEGEVDRQLKESKLVIEKELGVECVHFAAPWGRRGVDFDEEILIRLAKENKYKTVVTTNRGKVCHNDGPFLIRRDHLLANWGNSQLDYFFGE